MPHRSLSPEIRSLLRALRTRWRTLLAIALLFTFEVIHHVRSLQVAPLVKPLDEPFYIGCQEPKVDGPRSNATAIMLARNSDVEGAVSAIKSWESQFNHWFHYPIVFLNDQPWEREFKDALAQTASGEVFFETIDAHMWGFPDSIDQKKALRKMKSQVADDVPYVGLASYHHMCRFNSGFFYDHPALKKYKWYWRIEPDVDFTCTITYDPFVEMEKHGKKYGYTVALWELGKTVPSLYRKVSDWKEARGIQTTRLWTALIDPSWVPWPFRRPLSLLRNRDANGDLWNMCHFWSNFEIADMDFYRSKDYRDFFEFLEADGGFYYERWGDAPVHSLATALFLDPSEMHHFKDWGYVHPPFQYAPIVHHKSNQLPDLRGMDISEWEVKYRSIGCRCKFTPDQAAVISPVCLNQVQRALA